MGKIDSIRAKQLEHELNWYKSKFCKLKKNICETLEETRERIEKQYTEDVITEKLNAED